MSTPLEGYSRWILSLFKTSENAGGLTTLTAYVKWPTNNSKKKTNIAQKTL